MMKKILSIVLLACVLLKPAPIKAVMSPLELALIGAVVGGFRPSEMSAPLLLVIIRGKLPALNTGGHVTLLSKGDNETREDFLSRLESRVKHLKEFKENHLPSILNPPKRAAIVQQPGRSIDDDHDPFVVN